ncbi:hypothetical protein Tco_0354306, partial [Tanacetum coccineum]
MGCRDLFVWGLTSGIKALIEAERKNRTLIEAARTMLADSFLPNTFWAEADKYVAEILKKFDFANVKTASTPIETQKPLVKDEEASDVDVL